MLWRLEIPGWNNPIKLKIQFHMPDVVCFQSNLALAAFHVAMLQGRRDNVEALTHKDTTLRILNQRLQVNPSEDTDGILAVVMDLTNIEVRVILFTKMEIYGNLEREYAE
jgi:hypothetical protein